MSVAVVRQLKPEVPARVERVRHHRYKDTEKNRDQEDLYLHFFRWQFRVLIEITASAAEQRLVEWVLHKTFGKQEFCKEFSDKEKLKYGFVAELLDVTDAGARLIVGRLCRRGILEMQEGKSPTTFTLKPLIDNWEYLLAWRHWLAIQNAILAYAEETGDWVGPTSCASLCGTLRDWRPGAYKSKKLGKAEDRRLEEALSAVSEADMASILTDLFIAKRIELRKSGGHEFSIKFVPPAQVETAKEKAEEQAKESSSEVKDPVVITKQPLVVMPGSNARPVPLPQACRAGLAHVHFAVGADVPAGLSIHATVEANALRVAIASGSLNGKIPTVVGNSGVHRNGKNPTVVGNLNGHGIDSKGLKEIFNPMLRDKFGRGLDETVAGQLRGELGGTGGVPLSAIQGEFAPMVAARFKRDRENKLQSPMVLVPLAREFRSDWDQRQKDRDQDRRKQSEFADRQRLEVAYREFRDRLVERYIADVMPPADWDAAVKRHLKDAKARHRMVAPEEQQRIAENAARAEVLAGLDIPPFDAFDPAMAEQLGVEV